MKISLIDCHINGKDTALAFHIELPDSWNTSDQKNVALNSLKFKIYLNDCETDAFRDRTVDPPMNVNSYGNVSCEAYTIRYASCTLSAEELAAVHTLTLVPYFDLYSEIYGYDVDMKLSNGEGNTFRLDMGETYSCFTLGNIYHKYEASPKILMARFNRVYLDQFALTIPIRNEDAPGATNKPIPLLHTVTIWDEAWTENEKNGLYRNADHAQIPCGSYYNKQLDFSGTLFVLESFQMSNFGMLVQTHWVFPDSWTVLETQSTSARFMGFTVFLDGIEYNKLGYDVCPLDFSNGYNTFQKLSIGTYQTESYRDIFMCARSSSLALVDWKKYKELTIMPFVLHYESVGGGQHTLLSGDSVVNGGWLDYETEKREYIPELAIKVTLNETIWNAGL